MSAHLHGLSMACPVDQSNPCDCPLSEIRKRPPIERFKWVEGLTRGQVEGYLESHCACLKKKVDAFV